MLLLYVKQLTIIAQYHQTCDQWVRRLLTPGSGHGPGVNLRSLTCSKFQMVQGPLDIDSFTDPKLELLLQDYW